MMLLTSRLLQRAAVDLFVPDASKKMGLEMITICSRWESSQMSADLEWRMWRQLKGSFGIDRFVFVPVLPEMETVLVDQYATMEEALASCEGTRVFLEPTGGSAPPSISGIEDVVLVLGNTESGNASLARPEDKVIRIAAPNQTDMYGINAAAIALAYRHGQ